MVLFFINLRGKQELVDLDFKEITSNKSQKLNKQNDLLSIEAYIKTQLLSCCKSSTCTRNFVENKLNDFYLTTQGGCRITDKSCRDIITNLKEYDVININAIVCGGIDFQHREGSKVGSGGQSSEAQAAIERKERLRKLALETIDITKDPYIMKNHLGSFECKLCLTLHPNEGNYLAHTQGKRHQSNLGRRASMEAKNAAPKPLTSVVPETKKRVLKIGRPGYKVTRSRDLHTQQRSLMFELEYTEAAEDIQPRHRFMSAFEQKVDTPPDKNYQYLLLACEPYETIAFKIPNQPIDKTEGRFFTNWDQKSKKFVLQLFFVEQQSATAGTGSSGYMLTQ